MQTWTMFDNDGSYQIRDESIGKGYYSIVGVFSQRNAHPVHGGGISGDTAKAHAILAVAAPELLAALHVALRAPGIHTTDQETGETFADVISAAIAKATT